MNKNFKTHELKSGDLLHETYGDWVFILEIKPEFQKVLMFSEDDGSIDVINTTYLNINVDHVFHPEW